MATYSLQITLCVLDCPFLIKHEFFSLKHGISCFPKVVVSFFSATFVTVTSWKQLYVLSWLVYMSSI